METEHDPDALAHRTVQSRCAPPHDDRDLVAVIGAGYVGLVTAACLAHLGATVVCADLDERRVAALRSGEIPFVETGLEQLVAAGCESGQLRFVVGAAGAVDTCGIVFICVPTPEGPDGMPEVSFVDAVATEIGPVLRPGAVVVNKSTVPVGTAERVARIIDRSDVAVVSNPEFLREGSAVNDFLSPDRVVIGSHDPNATQRVARLYAPLGATVVATDPVSAETIKYVANGFLATKISFANSVATLCDAVGAHVDDVIGAMALDTRIGPACLTPGPGWGGSCFPKDSTALIGIADRHGYEFPLMRAAIQTNRQQLDRTAELIASAAGRDIAAGDDLEGVNIAVLGLTFKAGTSDLRQSPSLAIIDVLRRLGATVRAFDPTTARDLDPVQQLALDGLELVADAHDAAAEVDVTAVLTEWPEFAELDLRKLADTMRGSAIVDARNLLNPSAVRDHGLTYVGMGRR